MKKFSIGLAVLLVLVFFSGSMAQPKPAPAKPSATMAPAAPAEKLQKTRGILEKVDEAAKTIEVKGRRMKAPMTFAVNEKTKIMVGQKEVPLAELKKGVHVTVEYRREEGRMIAVKVEEAVPKSAAKKGKPAEETKK